MLNKCCFIGNLGKDPEVRKTQQGKSIIHFSLGVTERWKDQSGERRERTEWVRVTIFSEGLAKIAESYLRKGSKVYLEGQLETRKWTDKDGVEKYSTEIVLKGYSADLVLLDKAEKRDERQEAPRGGYEPLDDEIPF